MPVNTHFPNPPDPRMPENPGGVDDLGIRYEGPVLRGLLGVREAFREQTYKLCGPRESNLPDLGPGVRTEPVPLKPQPPNRADALVSVDPVVDVYRSQFGPPPSTNYSSPEQYDAVLRSHLHMGPAPDPYEDQRRRRAGWQSFRH